MLVKLIIILCKPIVIEMFIKNFFLRMSPIASTGSAELMKRNANCFGDAQAGLRIPSATRSSMLREA